MLNKKEFQILSGKTGFLPHYLEKVYRLLAILEEISRNQELGDDIALKGGTAINHFFYKYPRLSIDLDFDYLIPVSKEDLEVRMDRVEVNLGRIFRFLRYEISRNSLAGHRQYYLKYRTLFDSHDTLKVEINYLLRQHLEAPNTRKPQSPFNLSFESKILSKEEVYAAKFMALLDRGTPRDLFDVYYLITHLDPSFSRDRLRRYFLFYACLSARNIGKFKEDMDVLGSITEKDIKDNLWMLIGKEDRIQRRVMMKAVTPFVQELLTLNADEKKFFDLFNDGKPEFGLLFGDKNLAQGLAEHPMVLWRLQNRK